MFLCFQILFTYKTFLIIYAKSCSLIKVCCIKNGVVIDAINASGGLKENANTYSVNLSKKITDEMVIIVPSNSENTNVSNNTITQNTKNSSLVNINTATTKELLSITGIGESKASNIVKYREENGNFSSIEDIKNVSGIGDSLFEKIKKYITV